MITCKFKGFPNCPAQQAPEWFSADLNGSVQTKFKFQCCLWDWNSLAWDNTLDWFLCESPSYSVICTIVFGMSLNSNHFLTAQANNVSAQANYVIHCLLKAVWRFFELVLKNKLFCSPFKDQQLALWLCQAILLGFLEAYLTLHSGQQPRILKMEEFGEKSSLHDQPPYPRSNQLNFNVRRIDVKFSG